MEEVRQKKTNTVRFPLYEEPNQTNEHNRKRLTDREKRLVVSMGEGEGWAGEISEGDKEVQNPNCSIDQSRG